MNLTEFVIIFKKDIERWYFYANINKKATTLDIIKNIFNPRITPVFLYRLSHFLYRKNMIFLSKFFSMINFILFGLEITIQCEIGPGLIFPHTQGIVIGSVKIGENALIYNGVTIGAKKMDINFNPKLRPIIGNNVMIGSGAKILGGITIGDNVIIGANAVVTQSVSKDKLVLGIPAREYSRSNG